jgi:hypothetical protein
VLLLGYGGAFAIAAFGRGLPAYDDHPGQFFRLWHALERSFPAGYWTADWNPDWWGGYPELQFYPPGFVVVGAAIRLLGFWQLSVEVVYQLLLGLTLLLPAVGTYALLRAVLGNAWLALPPALLALTLCAGLRAGVEESLRWGMLTSRLSLGFLPFLALSLRVWVEGGRPPVWAPLVAALTVLCHPVNGLAVGALLTLAALLVLLRRPDGRTAREIALLGALTLALVAFWTGPLLLRRSWLVSLAWSHVGGEGFLAEVRARPLLLVVTASVLLAWVPVVTQRRPFHALLAALPVVLLGINAANFGLFVGGWSAIEPGRLTDALVASALWAGGLGLGAVARKISTPRARETAHPVLALGVVAALGLVGLVFPGRHAEPTLTLWPRAAAWPSWRQVSGAHDLGRLFASLRDVPDRVLFTTSALRLTADRAWYGAHSHALGLAPIFARREIVHGTFTHPSPLAARFYTGRAVPPRRLDALAEQFDGLSLLGQPWSRLSPETFETFARRLRIATVVVPTTDAGRARFLPTAYAPAREVSGFTVFERRDRPWAEIERITHRRYRVFVSPSGGVWVATGVPAYPLWRVKSGRGNLETRADAWGFLEFRVPLDVFEAELVYAEGALEWLGLTVTGLGGVIWLGWAWRARRGASSRGGPARSRR